MSQLLLDAHDSKCNYEICSISNTPQLFLNIVAHAEIAPHIKSAYTPKPFQAKALIDSGATLCFIHPSLVQTFRLPKFNHCSPKKLRVIDGRDISSGQVTQYTKFHMNIDGHTEEIACHIADISNHQVVLGTSWLKIHNPEINWEKRTLRFYSQHCQDKCLDVPNIMKLSAGELIPSQYQDFQDVFLEKDTAHLPPHRSYDLEIELIPGAQIKHGPIYSTGPKEDEELCQTLKCQLEAGLICPSKSPMASPILFVKKKNGKLRLCVDY